MTVGFQTVLIFGSPSGASFLPSPKTVLEPQGWNPWNCRWFAKLGQLICVLLTFSIPSRRNLMQQHGHLTGGQHVRSWVYGVLIRHRKMEGMLKSRTWIQVLSSCAEIPTALKSQSTLHVHALVIHILNCHFSFQNTVHTLSIILYCTLFHLQARSFNHAAFDIAEGSGSNSQSAELSKPKLFLFLMAPPKKYCTIYFIAYLQNERMYNGFYFKHMETHGKYTARFGFVSGSEDALQLRHLLTKFFQTSERSDFFDTRAR